MRSVIHQSAVLPASAESLFGMYLDPVAHGAWSGGEVTIGPEPGDPFRAFGGALWGEVIEVVRPRWIVQSWRSTAFHEENPDSTLILSFTPEGDEGRIDLVHLDVPIHDYAQVVEGWRKYYWEPWRAYLDRTKR